MLACGRVLLALPPLADLPSFALPLFFLLFGAAEVSMIFLLYFLMWVPRMMGRVDRVSTEDPMRSVYLDGGRRSFEEKIKK